MRLASCILSLAALAACGSPIDSGRGGPDAARDGATLGDGGVRADGDVALDGGGDGGGGADAGPMRRTRYSLAAPHSPISPRVVASLRDIAARDTSLDDAVFAKVGDSITVSTAFLHCFAGSSVDLDGRDALTATLDYYRAGDAAGTTPFDRVSLAASVGRTASWSLTGTPTPVDQELAAITPRVAVVMFGTNDVGFVAFESYENAMLDVVDALADRGVVPILSSIPARDDNATADAKVPLYNLIVRGLAEGREIPFLDLHQVLAAIGDHGLGGDGVHPTAFGGGSCVFTAAALADGYNVRNLLTLEALDRTRRALFTAEPAPDPDAPRLVGAGTRDVPYAIDALPFTDLETTLLSASTTLDAYDGCMATQDESGPEIFYRLELAAPTRVSAHVYDRGDVDVDVHLLDATGTTAGCIARDHHDISADLAAGTYYLVVDSFVGSDAVPRAGEYLLVVEAG